MPNNSSFGLLYYFGYCLSGTVRSQSSTASVGATAKFEIQLNYIIVLNMIAQNLFLGEAILRRWIQYEFRISRTKMTQRD